MSSPNTATSNVTIAAPADLTAYHDLGSQYFGPFLHAYVAWLRNQVAEIRPERILFLSRDGYMMQRAYELMEQSDKDHSLGIPSAYVHFSRASLRQPLLWTKSTFQETFQLLSWQRYVTLREVLAFWGLTTEEANEVADAQRAKGVDIDHAVFAYEQLPQSPELEALYAQWQSVINERSRAQYQALGAYLEQIGMRGRVVIVDIGWHGTMQHCLEQLLAIYGIEAQVVGLYVGIDKQKNFSGEARGFVYDNERLDRKTDILSFLGVVEKLFQSCEGSAVAYHQDAQGTAHPTLAPYEYEAYPFMVQQITAMQQGALECLGQRLAQGTEPSDADVDHFLNLGKNPSLRQTAMFRSFFNIDNDIKFFLLPQKPLWHYTPRQFVLALNQSQWKTGFMRQAFKMPLPYHFIYKLLKR